MDLLFALSASSAKSSRTYPLMKKAINYIISTYGIDSIHYGVIVYGSLATIHRNFDDQIPDSESLMRLVSALPSDSSGSSIDKALQRAEQVFGGPGVRPDAKKVGRSFIETILTMNTTIFVKSKCHSDFFIYFKYKKFNPLRIPTSMLV